ncbi:hypothetical protein L4C42_09360 [Vibrio wakamikoensis]|jgi:hypothetical protein|uniref:Sulfotransferase domain-containing protein n=1 Tax=Vibrio chaetopteri TaxID=3016528 RepID=A0AAU8BKP0_9VIBR
MTRVVIHIGTEKTGTTSVQHFFDQNRAKLKELGVLYPHVGPRKDAHFDLVNELHPLDNNGKYMEFLPKPTTDIGFYWGQLRQRIEDNPEKTVFLSAEHFSSRLRDKALEYMSAFFSSLGIEPEILVFLRPQDEFLESTYSTAIKSGSSQSFEQMIENYQAQILRYDYEQLLALWSRYFGKHHIKVMRYQTSEGEERDVRKRILNYLSVKESETLDFSQSKSLNVKWGRDMLEFARLCNLNIKPRLGNKRLLFLETCSNKLPAKPNERLLTFEQREAIEKYFSASNSQVAMDYLGLDTLFVEREPVKIDESTPARPLLTKLSLIEMLAEEMGF